MIRQCTIKTSAILAVIILACGINTLNAAWWERKNIPLPAGAEEARQETRRIGGSELVLTYYTTAQENTASIKSFYRRRLPELGWKEKNLVKDLQQVPGMQVNAAFRDALEQNLMFEKGTDLLMINFMPEGAFRDAKTRFAIIQGKMDFKEPLADKKKLMPELLTKPKKKVAPDYPTAKLINLVEGENSLQATYYTQDDIESASRFYKETMPSLGWSLNEEKPVQEVSAGAGNYDISKYCPACLEGANSGVISMKNKISELSFSNQKGGTCTIAIFNQSSSQIEGTPFGSITTITVDYEGKKG